MKILEFLSYMMIPLMIISILIYAYLKKINIYKIFLEGIVDGLKVIYGIFPTLLSIMLAIKLFKFSGGFEIVMKMLLPISKIFKIPSEIIPLGIMRSVSGGASMGLLADNIKNYGVDSYIGRVAATIMGSSETTLYVIAVYLAGTKVKNTKNILLISLISDFIAVFLASILCQKIS